MQRSECKDVLTVYDAQSWQVLSRIFTSTQDAADLSWSPDSSCIAVWDNLAYGHLLEVYSPAGKHLASHDKGTHLLGIKSLAWSPSGQLLAIGGHDQDAWILNHITWSSLATLSHPTTIASPPSIDLYQEEVMATPAAEKGPNKFKALGTNAALSDRRQNADAAAAAVKRNRPAKTKESTLPPHPFSHDSHTGMNTDDEDDIASRCIVVGLPLKLPAPRPPLDRPNPKMGIGISSWSADGAYLATRCDARPHVLWIWDSSRLELASVVQLTAPIKTAEWDPSGRPRLVVGCGSRQLYLWTPTGVAVEKALPGTKILSLAWNRDGSALLAIGKDSYCIAHC